MTEKQSGRSGAVVIVGTGSVQNRLLARVIERAGYGCTIVPARADEPAGAATLALADAAELGEQLPSLCASLRFATIAVLNADVRFPCERIVGLPGIKGVFFSDTSEEQLLKGIAAIFRGEYWLPRRLLCAHLELTRSVPNPPGAEAGSLTRKEMETLELLAGGRSTGDIAQALKVSPHTVKTHLYNLFRKIRVTNRVQAMHWAAQNLRRPDSRLPG